MNQAGSIEPDVILFFMHRSTSITASAQEVADHQISSCDFQGRTPSLGYCLLVFMARPDNTVFTDLPHVKLYCSTVHAVAHKYGPKLVTTNVKVDAAVWFEFPQVGSGFFRSKSLVRTPLVNNTSSPRQRLRRVRRGPLRYSTGQTPR